MRLKGVACAFVGHDWVQPADFHEAYPVFECTRCGRSQAFPQGSSSAGYDKRLEARTGADKIFLGRGGRR